MAGIVRLIRRIWVLREQGEAAHAKHLQENELAVAIRDFRLALGPDALPETELQAIIATEEQRVAEAAILSELLLPRLAGLVPARPGLLRSAGASPGPALAVAQAAGPPAISTLLDAMLAAERADRRLAPAGKRQS